MFFLKGCSYSLTPRCLFHRHRLIKGVLAFVVYFLRFSLGHMKINLWLDTLGASLSLFCLQLILCFQNNVGSSLKTLVFAFYYSSFQSSDDCYDAWSLRHDMQKLSLCTRLLLRRALTLTIKVEPKRWLSVKTLFCSLSPNHNTLHHVRKQSPKMSVFLEDTGAVFM